MFESTATKTKPASPRRRKATALMGTVALVFLIVSVALTRPSRFREVAKPPADVGTPDPTRITASISVSHESLRGVVDRMFSRAIERADSEVRSEVRSLVEERSGIVRLFVDPDVDRLHFPHTVTFDVEGKSVRFVVDAEGEFDVPWSRADYGLSLHASIRASPRMDAGTGAFTPDLSVDVHEFRTGGSDRSALLRQGGEFTATFYRGIPFEVDVPVSIPSLDSVAESIEGSARTAARDAMMQLWNGLCDAFPLSGGATPTWLLVRPTGLRFRQVHVTQSATNVQILLDLDVGRVNEHADVECPFPKSVTVTESDLLDAERAEGPAGDLEAAVALDVGFDVLGDVVHVVLDESEMVDRILAPWVAERISVEGIRIGSYRRDGVGGRDGAALLLEADVAVEALGLRSIGTVYVAAVPVLDEGTGEVFLTGIEIDTESRHPLFAVFLEVGEAVRAVFSPFDGEPVRLRGDFGPYIERVLPRSVASASIGAGEARVVGIGIEETRLRVIVQGRGPFAVR